MTVSELKRLSLIERLEMLKEQVDLTLSFAKGGSWFVQADNVDITGHPETHLLDVGYFTIHARYPDFKSKDGKLQTDAVGTCGCKVTTSTIQP